MKENSESKEIRDELIKLAGMTSARFSLSPIAGQIYALLYVSARPVSLNDMVKELKISKGSASTNIRALEAWGAVRKVWVSSDRKDYYEANPDITNIVFRRFKEGLGHRLSDISSALDVIEDKIKAASKKGENADIKLCGKRFEGIKNIVLTAEKILAVLPKNFPDKKFTILKKLFK